MAADGHAICTMGRINDVSVTLGDATMKTDFYVLKNLEKPILSRQALKMLKLIPHNFPHVKVNHMEGKVEKESKNCEVKKISESKYEKEFDALKKKYPSVFDGKVKIMKSEKTRIKVDQNAIPVSTGAFRSVPEPQMEALKKEIDNLLEQGIIERVNEATPWLHPIVVVPKKGTNEIRMVTDPSKLNQCIEKPVSTQMPPWEVVRKIPLGHKFFTVLDAKKAYYQIELDDESKNLTAFLTPFGRMRYTRLPMGLNISSDEFDRNYGKAVDHLPNIARICEDTLIYGKTKEECLEMTENFLKTCAENNITLNESKVQWLKQEVIFAGYLIKENGYQIDPKLNEALRCFPRPENVTDLRSFFGLANQTCNFSDQIAKIMDPLKPLLKKGNHFSWLDIHEQAFIKAREMLSSKKTLTYYNPKNETQLKVDASRIGLGFVLKQFSNGMWNTVQAGSRFLSEAETRYAMIELELLAIVWAAKKTRMLIEGLSKKNFTIFTDHMPLVPILSKYSLPQITNKRLQRLRMKIDHLQFNITWIKGKDNSEADALSRAPFRNPSKSDQIDEHENDIYEKENIAKICLNAIEMNSENKNDNDLDARLKEIVEASRDDETYQELKNLIKTGFPPIKTNLTASLTPFWHAKEDLHFDENGLIVFQERLFIPKSLRTVILKRLLGMHQSTEKMISRARQCVWWPLMNKDVKNISMSCKPCQEYKQSNRKEKWINHEIPSYPFEFVHCDFGQHQGRHYLIVADQFSSYPFVKEFSTDPTTDMLTETLTLIFSQFAIPRKLFSDGGPQFTSSKFLEYCKRWGISHETSSPHHPQSNGFAEAAIKQMKKIIRGTFIPTKRQVDAESFGAGILLFRNTPCSPTDRSPAEILFGRQLRDNLPVSRKLLKPNLRFDVEKRRRESYEKKNNYSPQYELPLLQPGTRVFVQHPATKRWTTEGSVIKFGNNEREYLIKMDSNDKILRRNRRFLRPQHVPTEDPPVQPVPPMSSFNNRSDPETPMSSPTRRSYAEVAAEQPGKAPIDRPKRDIRKPVRFSDENFVYENKNKSKK
jgi:transposase InsO family protein